MTPQCPGCGAKFQHDRAKEQCKVCGLPDELIAHGPEAIRAWQRGLARERRPERKAAKVKQPTATRSHKALYKKLSREKRRAA